MRKLRSQRPSPPPNAAKPWRGAGFLGGNSIAAEYNVGRFFADGRRSTPITARPRTLRARIGDNSSTTIPKQSSPPWRTPPACDASAQDQRLTCVPSCSHPRYEDITPCPVRRSPNGTLPQCEPLLIRNVKNQLVVNKLAYLLSRFGHIGNAPVYGAAD